MNTARKITILGIGLGTSALVGWFLLRESGQRHSTSGGDQDNLTGAENHIRLSLDTADTLEAPAVEAADVVQASVQQPDDLTRINDIGPRFAEALNQLGIVQFSQLAQQDAESLAQRLSALVNVRAQRILNNDWIGQAARFAENAG